VLQFIVNKMLTTTGLRHSQVVKVSPEFKHLHDLVEEQITATETFVMSEITELMTAIEPKFGSNVYHGTEEITSAVDH